MIMYTVYIIIFTVKHKYGNIWSHAKVLSGFFVLKKEGIADDLNVWNE